MGRRGGLTTIDKSGKKKSEATREQNESARLKEKMKARKAAAGGK